MIRPTFLNTKYHISREMNKVYFIINYNINLFIPVKNELIGNN